MEKPSQKSKKKTKVKTYKVPQAAKLLGCHPETVRRHIDSLGLRDGWRIQLTHSQVNQIKRAIKPIGNPNIAKLSARALKIRWGSKQKRK